MGTRPLTNMSFGPNPGQLRAKAYVPSHLGEKAALVVVLHGCTQTPEAYDRGTGWSFMAEQHGFAVLYPEQQRSNNMNGCFNWFEPGDMQREKGEPASIKNMIDAMVANHSIDPARIFITGLSAGAAMAGVMLATYPEAFAGGGLIAGLPYGTAKSMPAAFSRMRSRGHETDSQLAALVREASDFDGPWPAISIWHGTADTTVAPSNADTTVAQWCAVHAVRDADVTESLVDGHTHRVWRDRSGRNCVETYEVTAMGHGTPLDAQSGENVEIAGAFLIDVGLSSTQHLAATWGLTKGVVSASARPVINGSAQPQPRLRVGGAPMPTAAGVDVQGIIENALRTAGLMR